MGDQKKTAKEWSEMSLKEKITGAVGMIVIVALLVGGVIWAISLFGGNKSDQGDKNSAADQSQQASGAETEQEKRVREAIASAEDGKCTTDYTVESVDAGYTRLVEGAVRTFVNTGREVLKADDCNHYTLQYLVDGEGGDGSPVKSAIITLEASQDTFNSYDWSELEGTAVGEKLVNDDVLILSLAVQREVDLDIVVLTH